MRLAASLLMLAELYLAAHIVLVPTRLPDKIRNRAHRILHQLLPLRQSFLETVLEQR
jgi:hypothetical protein